MPVKKILVVDDSPTEVHVMKKALEKVQEVHDKYIAQVDDITKKKEAEVMEV